MSRRFLLWILSLAILSFAGCEPSATRPVVAEVGDSPDGATPVAIQLNWYPEAEHGAVYQAKVAGYYADAGLDVEIRPGGRATPVAPEVHFGRSQFAITNADDVVLFRGQGMDVVAVLAGTQNSPRCILVREDSGVESLQDLGGMTLQRQTGRPYLEFMRSRGLLDRVQEVPYHGSVASLVADPKIAVQAYSYSEPLLARQQGVGVRTLMVSELGWNPYSSVLMTSSSLIEEQPELVRRFVQATRRGWQAYLADPTAGNEAILEANRHGMTADVLQFGSEGLRELALPGGVAEDQVGMMTPDRWQRLIDQMVSLNLVDPSEVDAEDCFTTDFL